jgi:cytochrome P450
MQAMEPRNPIDAVTHPDPYPYYARLLAGPPLHYDNELRLWIACRAVIVSEIFASPDCRVRPMAEPIPALISGSPAGEIFGALVRMNDGARHDQPKLALERALASPPLTEVDARARHLARQSVPAAGDARALSTWICDIAVIVVADLLGFADDTLPTLATWTREFAACLSPLSTSEQLAAASAAASRLRSRMQFLLQSTQPASSSLLAQIRDQAEAVRWTDSTAVIANLVGLLSQSYEATAGLIGNAIVALATRPRLIEEVRARADGWDQLVYETSRFDSPVQNTRRYIVHRTRLAGVDLEPGSAVLLVLAAANRDPNANPCPHEFRLDRSNRCVFTFSRGAHACPGEALARTIAAAAVSILIETPPNNWLWQITWSWRPSANGRLPVFQSINESVASS